MCICCFIWFLRYDRLLTNINKSRMRIRSMMCRLYGSVVEDSLHVFCDYPLVMPMWVYVNWKNSFSGDLEKWFNTNMNNNLGWNEGGMWIAFWAVSCHNILSWRNKKNHEDHYIRPNEPNQFITYLVQDHNNVFGVANDVIRPTKETGLISWKPPTSGWVNMNRACLQDESVGYGSIIRDINGNWI